MREIALTQDKVSLVDEEDYWLCLPRSWSAINPSYNKWYAVTYVGGGRENSKLVLMHRFIFDLDNDRQVDHIDGNGLNNQRSNLRIVTAAQQSYNKKKQQNCTSQYKGVTWWSRDGTWKAQIMKNGVNYHLGYFQNELDAALAYDSKSKELHGEHGRRNF